MPSTCSPKSRLARLGTGTPGEPPHVGSRERRVLDGVQPAAQVGRLAPQQRVDRRQLTRHERPRGELYGRFVPGATIAAPEPGERRHIGKRLAQEAVIMEVRSLAAPRTGAAAGRTPGRSRFGAADGRTLPAPQAAGRGFWGGRGCTSPRREEVHGEVVHQAAVHAQVAAEAVRREDEGQRVLQRVARRGVEAIHVPVRQRQVS